MRKYAKTTGILIAVSLLLEGCTGLKTTKERPEEPTSVAAESRETQNSTEVTPAENHAEEADILFSVEETAYPDPVSVITLREGERTWTYDAVLTGDTVACLDRGYSGNYENWYFYTQIYDSNAGGWITYDTINGNYHAEIDGIEYYGMQNIYSSIGDKLYTNAYIPEQEEYFCETDKDGFRRILCAFPKEEQEIEGDTSYYIDKDERIYLYSKEERNIRCYDKEGKLDKTVEVPGNVYGILQKEAGAEVYWYGTNLKLRPVIGSLSTGEITAENGLDELSSDYKATMAEDGTIFLADTQNLFCFLDGTLQKAFRFGKNGYIMSRMYDMKCAADGSLYFLVEMDNSIARLILTEVDSLPEKQEIVYADLTGNATLAKSIARFNRRSEKYHVTLQLPESIDDNAAFQQEIQLAMGTGNGPDLIGGALLTDVEGYVGKGYLEELGDIVGEKSLYVNGALDTCRVNGLLYGIPYECSFDLVAYDKKTVGNGNSLSIEDFMGLVEKSDTEIVQEDVGGSSFILKYVLNDEENTAYIDWKGKKCNLTGQEFLRILEFAKKYADTGNTEKEAFAYCPFNGFDEFRRIKDIFSHFDGDAVLLGYPKEGGNGIYVSTSSIYLFAGSEVKEGAKEFLQFLISADEQEKYASYSFAEAQNDGMSTTMWAKDGAFPVVKSAYDGMIKAAKEKEEDNVKYLGELPYTDAMIEQIYYVIDHAEPGNARINAISGMVYEELEPYFSGDISAKEAAEKLQNRVQLYLNER